jgi:hypothetical protein
VSSTTASVVQYLGTLTALATVTITLAVIGDEHAGEALAGTLGFAVSARPIGGGASSPPVVAAATLGLAGALAIAATGCTAADARAAGTAGCQLARKLCAAVSGACAVADATAGSEDAP